MADTLFMIHGMGGGPWCWRNYRQFFESQGHACVLATLPFHHKQPGGVPDPRLGTIGLRDYVASLERQLSTQKEKPVLIGHSLGGLLAQLLAVRGLARALVLLAPAPPAGIFVLYPSAVRGMWSIFTARGFRNKPVKQTLREVAYSTVQLLAEKEQTEFYRQLGYESGRVLWEIAFWLLDPRGAARVDETKVRCPVLVVGAGKDRLIPPPVARRVAAKYKPLATYKQFDGHAHWLLGEPGWQDVATYILSWVKAL